jgi:hypothetical protein
MKPYRKFKQFQIRWKEPMGMPQCPYLYRWTFLLFGFSLRIHHWLRSDDRRHFHDHPCDFVSIVLRGHYTNVTPIGSKVVKVGSVWAARGDRRHYLEIPSGGAWTLLLCGRPYRKWGFWVNNHLWRPLRYFHKFGIPPCNLQ